MKKIIGVIAVGILLTAFTFLTGMNDVINAIRTGNANTVSKYFDNTVEISVAGKGNNYSKSQAEAILRDFFANNTVKSFTVIHQGEAGGSLFCIGTLSTSNGSFRTTLNLKQKGGKQLLQEIKFDN